MPIADLMNFLEAKRLSLFHFTDTKNLPSIRQHGLLSLRQLHARNIAIPAPGGNDWSHDADRHKGLDDYVHLCFRTSHPMEYKARKDSRIAVTRFIQISEQILLKEGIKFSLEVSNKSGTPVLNWDEFEGQCDWEVIYARTDWSDPEIRKRLRVVDKYEILVPESVDLHLLRNL